MIMVDKVCMMHVVLGPDLSMLLMVSCWSFILPTDQSTRRIKEVTDQPVGHGPVEEIVKAKSGVKMKENK